LGGGGARTPGPRRKGDPGLGMKGSLRTPWAGGKNSGSIKITMEGIRVGGKPNARTKSKRARSVAGVNRGGWGGGNQGTKTKKNKSRDLLPFVPSGRVGGKAVEKTLRFRKGKTRYLGGAFLGGQVKLRGFAGRRHLFYNVQKRKFLASSFGKRGLGKKKSCEKRLFFFWGSLPKGKLQNGPLRNDQGEKGRSVGHLDH